MKRTNMHFKFLFYTALIFFTTSCKQGGDTTKKASAENITKYMGVYVYAEKNDLTGEIQVMENCWTGGVDEFEIYGSEKEGYFVAFSGQHVLNFNITEFSMKGDTLIITAVHERETEDSAEGESFMVFPVQKSVIGIINGPASFLYVSPEEKDNFKYIPCEEGEIETGE